MTRWHVLGMGVGLFLAALTWLALILVLLRLHILS